MKIPRDQFLTHLVTLTAAQIAAGRYTQASADHIAEHSYAILLAIMGLVPDAANFLSPDYE